MVQFEEDQQHIGPQKPNSPTASRWAEWLPLTSGGSDLHTNSTLKNQSGVLGIYGLIVSVIITQAISSPGGTGYNTYSLYNGYTHLAAGLCCGLSCLAAGGTIGVIGDAGVKAFGLKAERGRKWFWNESGDDGAGDSEFGAAGAAEAANKLYVGMLIMLIFSEALAL